MPTSNGKKGKDTAVQGTNDSSVVSKVSAAARGYFQDVFLQHFVCKVIKIAGVNGGAGEPGCAAVELEVF